MEAVKINSSIKIPPICIVLWGTGFQMPKNKRAFGFPISGAAADCEAATGRNRSINYQLEEGVCASVCARGRSGAWTRIGEGAHTKAPRTFFARYLVM